MEIILNNKLILPDLPENIKKIVINDLTLKNPKFLENQRMGRWNKDTPHEIKFYDESDKNELIIPRGYIRTLINHCKRENEKFEITDKRETKPEADFSFSGKLKPFQQKAADAMLLKDFGTLNAPTGSGKTVVSLYMVAMRKQPTLIIVHTKELANQWISRIETFLKIPKKEIGLIGSGKKEIGEKITVALVQSLYKCKDDVKKYVGNVIVDECHRIPSRSFYEAISVFNSKYLTGLTATPYRRDKLSQLIFWFMGNMIHEIEKSALIKKGDILSVNTIIRNTEFIPFNDPSIKYSKMLKELVTDKDRNILIAEDIAKESKSNKGICLVLSDRKNHCEAIQTILKYKYKTESDLLTGDLSVKKREEVFKKLENGKIKVLIATGQLLGEGFDLKELSVLFLATPIKFSGRLLQYLGRILRPAPNKESATVYDYVDVHVGPLKTAFESRQKVYSEL